MFLHNPQTTFVLAISHFFVLLALAMVKLYIVCVAIYAALSLSHTTSTVTAFTTISTSCCTLVSIININQLDSRRTQIIFSSPNDDNWGFEDSDDDDDEQIREEDPRLNAMRSMLQSSWDTKSMGIVPVDPSSASEAAAQSIADAMSQSKNVLMIDLRLPSYDITEGTRLYDMMAVYDFCSYLSDQLRERKLIRKSLVLVRNDKERAEIDRVRSQRGDFTSDVTTNIDDDRGEDEEWVLSDGEGSEEVDEFRKRLMTSWDDTRSDDDITTTDDDENEAVDREPSQKKIPIDNSSHRLWSMLGSNVPSNGPDMFDQVITAVDENALLRSDEDALILVSPYDTSDVIAIRRIMARYGQTRTIIIVNSRMENLPRELDPAILAYGVMPLIARLKQNENEENEEAGLKAVVMKRFPADWSVYVDVYGDGFVEARGGMLPDGSDKQFPTPQWIAQQVEMHVRGLPNQQ